MHKQTDELRRFRSATGQSAAAQIEIDDGPGVNTFKPILQVYR